MILNRYEPYSQRHIHSYLNGELWPEQLTEEQDAPDTSCSLLLQAAKHITEPLFCDPNMYEMSTHENP